ncbi:MAG TPA: efflux RND transporter periplasmic adaptor subunit [Blastocatellia bacterium]|nr:efflux RND transporter periplasmic adaptor subunit [Blastocatellia bacterium]
MRHLVRRYSIRMPRIRRVTAIRLTLVSLGALLVSSCSGTRASSGNRDAASPAVPVTAATVVQKTVPIQTRAIGNVEAYSTVQVKAQAGGELTKVHFTEGQFVKKGAMLFTIDPRPFEAAINQIEANIQRDVAQVRQAQATLAKDAAQARNAEVEAQRYADLLEKGVVSKEQYDQFRTSFEALQATVNADRAAINSSEQAVKADQANLASAKLQLAYCYIRSPIDGRTGSLMVHEGNLIKANDVPIVVIDQVDPIRVSFSVPEQQLGDIKKYSDEGTLKVEAVIAGQEQRPLTGTLSFLDNAVDTNTGTIRLKGGFSNPEKRLWPGQFVSVVLTVSVQPDAIVVPSHAVQQGQTGAFVFVINPDLTVESRSVVAGRSLDSETVIEKGLSPGERVVTDGQLRLVPGAE